MKVIAILATDKNGVIGDGDKLPWRLSDDLQAFKMRTEGNIVIMGRKTYESIGKPLPNRVNIVVSRHTFNREGLVSASSLEEALDQARVLSELEEKQIYLIGGAQLYNYAFKEGLVDEVIHTDVNVALNHLDDPIKVDMSFLNDLDIQESQRYKKDVRNEYDFTISRGMLV